MTKDRPILANCLATGIPILVFPVKYFKRFMKHGLSCWQEAGKAQPEDLEATDLTSKF
jgi:hypothetical protein